MPPITAAYMHARAHLTVAAHRDPYTVLAAPNNLIYVEDLYNAYAHVCRTKGISPLSYGDILGYLSSSGRANVVSNSEGAPVITHNKFQKVRGLERSYAHPHRYRSRPNIVALDPVRSRIAISNLAAAIALSLIADLIMVAALVLSHRNRYPLLLHVARGGAGIILINLGALLIHSSNVLDYIDHPLMIIASTGAPRTMHQMFGIKIVIGTVVHIVGHLLHVRKVLNLCREGCTHSDVLVVPKGRSPLTVSWSYFMKQPAYYSGAAISGLLLLIGMSAWAHRKQWLRSAWFYQSHRVLAVAFSLGIILHGVQQLLGLNLAYVFIAPTLLTYLASRYSEILCHRHLEIIGCHSTESMIRVCFECTPFISRHLDYGVAISAYLMHPETSQFEWHPFTISEGLSKRECYISVRRVGEWTNRFADAIMTSNIDSSAQMVAVGHVVPSCFRFRKAYRTKIFFCSGIGITPFLTSLHDPFEYTNSNLLVWSVNSIELLKEFSSALYQLSTRPNLDVAIFYSNSIAHIDPRTASVSPGQLRKFLFLQALVHYETSIDIVHGIQAYRLAILDRVNPFNIIARVLDEAIDTQPIGIFVCGGVGYTALVKHTAKILQNHAKKIKLHVWAEPL